MLGALAGGGAYFFRQLADAVGSEDDQELATALWDLVWSGLITNDTIGPAAHPHRRHGAARSRRPRRAHGRCATPGRRTSSTPGRRRSRAAGRCCRSPRATPPSAPKPTAELLLERHGVVTRGAVQNEGIVGGFALVYKVLAGFEETGRARRGYFIDGLGAAQFATGATVDRLRGYALDPDADPPNEAITLAATRPRELRTALHFPGPRRRRRSAVTAPAARPAPSSRSWMGASPSSWSAAASRCSPSTPPRTRYRAAAASLASTAHGALNRMRVERIDGEFAVGTPLGDLLQESGFARLRRGCGCAPGSGSLNP